MAKEIVEHWKTEKVSIAKACRVIDLDRSLYYRTSIKDDTEVEQRLRYYAEKLPTRGCPEYYKRIRKEGYLWNHKRVERVYKKLKMNKRKRNYKRRIPNPNKQVLLQPITPNLTWSMDFMHDRLENGRQVRVLNVIDDFNREALLFMPAFSFPSERVVEAIQQLIEWHGKPTNIRTDNGTEFLAKVFEDFCSNSTINHIRIQKGKPMQNGYVERFNRTFREDVLDAYIFENIPQMEQIIEAWMDDYNNHHPHASLGNCSPIEFKQTRAA